MQHANVSLLTKKALREREVTGCCMQSLRRQPTLLFQRWVGYDKNAHQTQFR